MTERRKTAWTAAALAALGFGMAWMSWRKWTEPLIDYGQQAYIPWRLNQGAVLYRDIQHFYGPFSQYLDAVLFRLFGTHLLTLALFNHLVVAVMAWMIFVLMRELADFASAAAGSAFFLAVFAFPQYTAIANFNWICPYVYEITHGTAFAFAAVLAFLYYLRERTAPRLAAVGLFAGLVFVTKIEVFVAIAAALGAGFLALAFLERPPARQLARASGILIAAAALPGAAFLAYFCAKMPAGQAWSAFWTPITIVFRTNIAEHPLYRWFRGTLDTVGSLEECAAALRWHATLLTALAGSCFLVARAQSDAARRNAVRAFWILSAAGLAFLYRRLYWVNFFRPLPLELFLLTLWCAKRLIELRESPEARDWVPRLVVCVFAFVMLWKTVLRVFVIYYGFALTLPAALILVAVLLRFLPDVLGRWFGPCRYVRPVAAGFVFVCALWYVNQCRTVYRFKTAPLGEGGDMIYEVSPRRDRMEQIVPRLLAKMDEAIPPGATLAVFPTGQIFNYWSRHPSSVRYDNYSNLGFLTAGGEDRVVRDLDANPPDWALLIDMDSSSGHGDPGHLGKDYGFELMSWLGAHYRPVYQTGPQDRSTYGVILMQKIGTPG